MPKSRCSNVTAFLLVKSYQLVGWVERSETQQVGESRGERGKLRVSRDEMRVVVGVLTPKKRVVRYQLLEVRLK